MSKVIRIQGLGDVGKPIERNYEAAIAMRLGNAAHVPAVGNVTMTREAFEYLAVRAGVLPEPHLAAFGQPLNAALSGRA